MGRVRFHRTEAPLLNSCHDSLYNSPRSPAPKMHLKASTIPLPSASTGGKSVAAYKPEHCPTTRWMPLNASECLCIGLDFLSLEQSLENSPVQPIST